MRKIFERVGDGVTAVAGLLLLAACAGSPPGTGRPEPALATAAATPVLDDAAADPSFDWHRLVIAPFGTRLVDSPIALHEVLLFHEEPRKPSEIESSDCYAPDGAPPRFAGYPPDEYLMCFVHDRLDRIDASVRIAAGDAARLLGRACALWLRNVRPLTTTDDACEGRDGDIAFSARLAVVPGELTSELLMTLVDAARRDAEREPLRDPREPPEAAAP